MVVLLSLAVFCYYHYQNIVIMFVVTVQQCTAIMIFILLLVSVATVIICSKNISNNGSSVSNDLRSVVLFLCILDWLNCEYVTQDTYLFIEPVLPGKVVHTRNIYSRVASRCLTDTPRSKNPKDSMTPDRDLPGRSSCHDGAPHQSASKQLQCLRLMNL